MKKANDGYKILFIILIVLMSVFGGIFSGKIIATSIEYSMENPYHFEKVVAVIVRIEKIESSSNWNDYYVRFAVYEDEKTGFQYEALIEGNFYNIEEAEAYIGQSTYILIDRENGKAISYRENAIKSDVPIDIIVYSVMLAFCFAVMILSIIKITKKSKKHWIWIAICIVVLLGLAAWVAYDSIDFNYLNALK
ncbi:MAG: hypothetical protein NC037_05935 [Bacteroides sp.]|nr:hypothetical protein [Bacillota bacterium]MCM1456044.1 hypothetical protein [Bacteroides sp.]